MEKLSIKQIVRAPVLVLLLLVCVFQEPIGAASTVRGRLFRVTPQGSYPASGIQVTLYNPQLGRSNPTFSGPDGMYYLYNIPPGSFTLQVWVSNPPWVFQIQVAPQAYTDIAPIRVP